jgi:hypothetical protein
MHVKIQVSGITDKPTINMERIETLLEITDSARDKIQEILSKNSDKYLRITLEAG